MNISLVLMLLVILIQHGTAQLKAETLGGGPNWKLVRLAPRSQNENKNFQYTLSINIDNDLKGYKVDLFFTSSVVSYEVSEAQGYLQHYLDRDRHLVLSSSMIDLSQPLIFTLNITYQLFNWATSKEFESFYFNEARFFGADRNGLYKPYTIDGMRRDCSSYFTYIKSNCSQDKIRLIFSYQNIKPYEGVTIKLIYMEDFSALESSEMKSTKDGNSEWTLQNLGWFVKKDDTVSFKVDLTSDTMFLNPYPMAVVFNRKILCGLPKITMQYYYAPVMDKSVLFHLKTVNDHNTTLLFVCVAFIVILTVMAITGTAFILFLIRSHNLNLFHINEKPGSRNNTELQEIPDTFGYTGNCEYANS